jgi:hypothetical protein
MEASGTRYIFHASRSDEFSIWNLSDVHYGNKACALDQFKRDVDVIKKDPFAFWVGGGDYAEYISMRDRRFDADTISDDLSIADLGKLGAVLTMRVATLLKPIRHKCLGLLFGNHEASYQRAQEQSNLHGWLCTELGVPNLGYTSFFNVSFVRKPRHSKTPELRMDRKDIKGHSAQRFRVFAHHGAGGATTPGGKLNRLIQYMHAFDADIYMIGHVHDQKGQRLVQITSNDACDKIVARERLGIISGSYLKTYAQGITTYGEEKGYAPVPLGASFVRIKPETREMRGEV